MVLSWVVILKVVMVGMFVLVVLMLAVSGMMFGMFLGHVRGEFGPVGSAAGFAFRSFFFGEFRNLSNCCFLSFFRFFFCLFFCFFFVEFGIADDGIDFRCFRSLFLLGFDEAGSQRGNLIFVQLNVIPGGLRTVSSGLLRRLDGCAACGRRLFFTAGNFYCGGRFCFSASIGQKPPGQTAGEPASNPATARSRGSQIAGCARSNFFDSILLLPRFMLTPGNPRWHNDYLVPLLYQPLPRNND